MGCQQRSPASEDALLLTLFCIFSDKVAGVPPAGNGGISLTFFFKREFKVRRGERLVLAVFICLPFLVLLAF